MEGVAIIKGGPNAENAKAFVRLRLAQGRAREDSGLCVPPRRARRSRPLKTARADAAADRRQARSTMTRTPGSISASKPRRRSRISSGVRADVQDEAGVTAINYRRRGAQLLRHARRSTTCRSPSATASSSRCWARPAAARRRLLRMVAGFCELDRGRILLGETADRHAAAAQAQHRHGVPELRGVSQPHRRRQRGLWPARAQSRQGRNPRTGRARAETGSACRATPSAGRINCPAASCSASRSRAPW